VVLDPFVGSGTTCVAALQNRRSYVGYETEPAYLQLAEQRIRAAQAELEA
jgi:site-specific DNA-methyltransferase (adenine-specific)